MVVDPAKQPLEIQSRQITVENLAEVATESLAMHFKNDTKHAKYQQMNAILGDVFERAKTAREDVIRRSTAAAHQTAALCAMEAPHRDGP